MRIKNPARILIALSSFNGILCQNILSISSGIRTGAFITQFALTFGTFLFFMGVGSFLSEVLKPRIFYLGLIQIICPMLVGSLLYFDTRAMDGPSLIVSLQLVSLVLMASIGVLSGIEFPLIIRIYDPLAVETSLHLYLKLDYFFMFLAQIIASILILPSLGVYGSFGLMSLGHLVILILVFTTQSSNTGQPR